MTRTEKTVVNSDGVKSTTITEKVDDGRGGVQTRTITGNENILIQ